MCPKIPESIFYSGCAPEATALPESLNVITAIFSINPATPGKPLWSKWRMNRLFFSEWQIAEKIKEDVFFVRKSLFSWNGQQDILLAQVWTGEGVEKKICSKEELSFRKKIREQRPLLIYKIGNTGKYIVLSHSSKKDIS